MIEANPLVSIIIPVYNGADFMREAIDSAVGQTYANTEVIVVNDGSSDNGETESIALSYGDRIRYYRKPNGGVSSALNFGIEKMQGSYFSWLSHDDLYTKDKIKNQVELLSRFEDKGLIALSGSGKINKASQIIQSNEKRGIKKNILLSWEQALEELLRNGSFNGCALLVPREAFEECGGFDETLRYSQDVLMWMKIFMHKHPLVYSDRTDVFNRVHSGQLTQRGRALFEKDSESIARSTAPQLAALSGKKYNFLYMFAMRNAMYLNSGAVEVCLAIGRERRIIPCSMRMRLRTMMIYGRIRPAVRRMYYRLFLRVKI